LVQLGRVYAFKRVCKQIHALAEDAGLYELAYIDASYFMHQISIVSHEIDIKLLMIGLFDQNLQDIRANLGKGLNSYLFDIIAVLS
jgi:hypothetical protein